MTSPFSLLLLSAARIHAEEVEDPLIRHVTSGKNTSLNNLLGADHHHFPLFKRKFGKSYATREEHEYRFLMFRRNMRRAARHQKMDSTASHDIIQFSDLTPKEFKMQFLGFNRLRLPTDTNEAPILPTTDLPEDFDWREKGDVSPSRTRFKVSTFRRSAENETVNH